MLTKSRGAIAASVLSIVAVGGSVAVIHAASPGSTVTAPAGLPVPAGSAATAAMPSGTGAGAGLNGTRSGSAGSGGHGFAGAQGPSPAARAAAALPRIAGQGDPGPLPAGAVPADGAVPGAVPAVRALAAARAALTVLPHSPRLMSELAGQASSPVPAPTAITAPTASATPSPGAAGTAGGTPAQTPTSAPTSAPATPPTATGTPAPMPTPSATSTPTATSSPTATSTPSVISTPSVTPTPETSTGTGAAGTGTAGGSSPAAAVVAAVEVAPSPSPSPSPAAPGAGAKAVTAAASTSLSGIDVAGYQHGNGLSIGWSLVAEAGYKFAAVKGTEGDYYVNPWATTDVAQAKAAGLDVTPYHFAIPNVSTGTQQAEYAVEYSGYATGTAMMPLMLDIEYDPYVSTDGTNECYGLSTGKMTSWIAAFVQEARSLTGQYPIIYTTANWWDTCTGGSTAFGADPMWVAAYGWASPPMPAGWPAWTFWQYSSGGTVPGVDSPGETDLDAFSPRAVGLIDPGGQASRSMTRVSVPVSSLGAMARETLAYSARGLPPGLVIDGNGIITGMLADTGTAIGPMTYEVRISVRNAVGGVSTTAFSWQVTPVCSRYRAYHVCPDD